MDMQSQMTRPYGHDQAEDPIRIHHPEEEENHEKGATKVLKKVKEKAKKIKNSLTKHGHEHDQDADEEDDYEYDEPDPEVHGAPVYESFAVRGGVTGHPESLSHPGETNLPAPEEIIPPGTKVFPVVTTDYTKPVEPEPLQDISYGHEAPFHPVTDVPSHPPRVFDVSEREESREDHQMPMHAPPPASLLSSTEDVTRTFAPGDDEDLGGQRRVNIGRPRGLEEDPAAPGGGSSYLSGVSNYQTKVTDPTHGGGGEAGVPAIVESLGKMKVRDESPVHKSGRDFEREIPTRSHEFGREDDSGTDKNSQTVLTSGSIAGLGEEFPARSHESGVKDTAKGSEETGPGLEKHLPTRSDDVKVENVLGRDYLPTGTHDQFSPELSRPKERDEFKETHEFKPTSYTEKIGSATSYVTDKAVAAKNAVASKLGYSGESGGQEQSRVGLGDETTPRSATGYGQKVAGTVTEKLTPVYGKVKETGSSVMTKLPLSGSGSGAEEKQHVGEKGVSTRDYLAEKLRPGEEDKALSEVIAEKLHLGGGDKKRTMVKEMEVTVEKIPTDQLLDEKEKCVSVKGGVTSWFHGTTEEVKPKTSDSVDDKSAQSLGSTVGTTGFSDSGGALPGQRGL
ncbi:low-temperature-induced 65 kDa protein [Raphanus sativus]|uniref:Low-temperature-induced 65 kDa protein n=1 Tax=Raphanus sativus TaxID=3726 RepID=A0A9W3CRB3_RAPSA|nr:low-temperature-induced 65 kDa protein [Raphanus sativus]